jgi:transposase
MASAEAVNRKQRKELFRRLKSEDPGLEVVHPRAAGIDVGNASHYVAVPPRCDAEPVREFGCFTEDLRRLAEWLKGCGIDTVVMQSTGVYWIPLYDILEAHGFEVFLVNAKYTRNLPGRKSDVQESQWLLKLHTYGLLNNSFRPPSDILTMRTYWRLRAEHVRGASSAIQRMQKALTQMNVQLANVISDISGLSGMAIIRAILAGERDPQQLADRCHARVQASREQVAKSLEGNWRADLLFVLQQEVDNYDHYQKQMAGCDEKLKLHLGSLAGQENTNSEATGSPSPAKQKAKKRSKKPKGNAPAFDLGSEVQRITGVDLTLIDGVDVMTAQTVLSEVGRDMSRWKSEGHFASWLGLCPDNRITGGKVINKGTRPVVQPLASALRMAASTLIKSESYLGAQYRRLRTRLGAPKAITAMAHKLARIIYRMLKYGHGYVDRGMHFYEQQFREQQILLLQKKAAKLGFQITQLHASA